MKLGKGISLQMILLILGGVLILSAICMLIYIKISGGIAISKCEKIVEEIERLIPNPVDSFPEERGNNTMSSMQIEKVNVAGIIEMPQYDMKLPFCSSWDTKKSASLPCRFSGSVYDSSLIIGSVDEPGQFDFVKDIELNNVMYLTDMEGFRYTYLVAAIERSSSASAEKLITDEYDLTVFVKASLSMEYIIIRFNFKSS